MPAIAVNSPDLLPSIKLPQRIEHQCRAHSALPRVAYIVAVGRAPHPAAIAAQLLLSGICKQLTVQHSALSS